MMYLERGTGRCPGHANWVDVQRIVVVRESQRDVLSNIDPRWKQVVSPEKVGLIASDRRKWIAECLPFLSGDAVRINADADIKSMSTNITYEDAWHKTPLAFARYLGQWILQFDKDRTEHGVTHAGFNDRENRPGIVAGIYPGHPFPSNRSRVYFKEPLTFESRCRGKYPSGYDFKEGAFRILDTWRSGDQTARYFPTVLSKTRKPCHYEDDQYARNLIAEFGEEAVNECLNLSRSGMKRNKMRKEK